MGRVFTFRGKSLDELQPMSVHEFAGLCSSRAKRTLLRSGIDKKLLKKINLALEQLKQGKEQKPIRTHLRDVVVLPTMVGLKFAIYRGNEFSTIEVKPEMLGHYFGEMVLTRKRLVHGKAGIGATKSSTAISARG